MVILVLGSAGIWGIRAFGISVRVAATPLALGLGVAGGLLIAGWRVAVQRGYRIAKVSAYAKALTASLARSFAHASWFRVLLGGAAAAVGEEVGNLLVPMVAHALFDMGAMVHFRRIMAGDPQVS